MIADPALEFWLRHVAADGGLWELAGDSAYVVLPGQLRDAYRLPEELQVTADPDVAREEGATLLTAGHPVLAEAADRVLVAGDAGYLVLDRPAAVPPGRDVLQAEVREAFPADHGRIDLSGEPAFVLHPVVRVGALAEAVLGAAAVVFPRPVIAALVACSYVAFFGFVAYARWQGGPLATCGCFGRPDTPPTPLHLLIDLVLATAAAVVATAARGAETLGSQLAHQPGAGVPLLFASAVGLWLAVLALSSLAALTAARRLARPVPARAP